MKRFSVTFERWDDSALEAGDTDDRGFVVQDVSLRDAMRLGLEYSQPHHAGFSEPSDSNIRQARWLSFHEWNEGTRERIETGVIEERALHIPDSVSPSSRLRIARLFGTYGANL